jgi:hypothetical protein
MADHALMIRTEMLSALSLLLGLTFALISEDSRRPYWQLGLASFCLTLAMMGKVQAIFPVLVVPAMVVLVGPLRRVETRGGVVLPPSVPRDVVLVSLVGLAVSIPAWHIVVTSVLFYPSQRSSVSGIYQAALVLYLIAAIVVYGRLHQKDWVETWLAAVFTSAGISAALYFHLLYHNMAAVDVLVNFVDHLYWASSLENRANLKGQGLPWKVFFDVMVSSIGQTIGKRFLTFGENAHPLNFLYWVSAFGFFVLIARRRLHAAIIVAAMLGASIMVEAAFGLYKVENKTRPYIEIWSILSATMAVSYLWSMMRRRGRMLTMALFAGVFAMEIVNLIKVNHLYYNTREYPCEMSKAYAQLIAKGFERYCQ